MFTYRTVLTLDNKGRVVIPVKVREELELKSGDTFVLEYADGIITLVAWDVEKK